MTRNIKLVVEYDGTGYCGFQDQGRPDRPTIQSVLQEALARTCQEPVQVIGAGRTDAGVHARGQVVNFHTRSRIPVERFPAAVNTQLPWDIKVREAAEVPGDFHARYWALSKTYRYTWLVRATPSPFWHRYALFVPRPVDVEKMRRAARHFVGEHDFAAFRSTGGGSKSTVRRMYRADVWRENDLVHFEIEGSGFLYNMVRIMAGTLLEVGLGRRSAECVPKALASGRREELGSTAPPHGLTLMAVAYPAGGGLENPEESASTG